jgi:F-type H+-transporting ATPase subunit b
MDLNATLFAEMFWFLLFVWFTMKFIWPPLIKNLQARKQQIADGLAAAEKGKRELEEAEHKAQLQLEKAKQKAAKIIEQAQGRVSNMLEEAKDKALQDTARMTSMAHEEIKQGYKKAQIELEQEVGGMALAIAEKLIQKRLDAAANSELIDRFIKDFKNPELNRPPLTSQE